MCKFSARAGVIATLLNGRQTFYRPTYPLCNSWKTDAYNVKRYDNVAMFFNSLSEECYKIISKFLTLCLLQSKFSHGFPNFWLSRAEILVCILGELLWKWLWVKYKSFQFKLVLTLWNEWSWYLADLLTCSIDIHIYSCFFLKCWKTALFSS